MDYNNYPNFTEKEFACSHCGKNEMQEVSEWLNFIAESNNKVEFYRP